MDCVNHTGVTATAFCQTCGKALCPGCVRNAPGGQVLCESCFAAWQTYQQPFAPLNTGSPNPAAAAVLDAYRHLDLGAKLKQAQRERALAIGVHEMTWTFDPLQSRNAHFNFSKLGVVSETYKVDFYGPETSSMLHRNGTDRLWVRWMLDSRRVRDRIAGKNGRAETLDALRLLAPLVRFDGKGKPVRAELGEALARERVSIEIPGDILAVEHADMALAREWREATRWGFRESLKAGFFAAEFCRSVRGQQGPGAYLLQRGKVQEFLGES